MSSSTSCRRATFSSAAARWSRVPNRRVVQALELVFVKFAEVRSIRQTFLWFQENRIKLPVNKMSESGMGIKSQPPTYAFIKNVLQNPFYAGAYDEKNPQKRSQ